MAEDEFDLEALHALVDKALGKAPPSKSAPKSRVPFSFGDTRLLAALSEILPANGVTPAQTQAVLSQLRDVLCGGIELGDLRSLHSISLHCRRCPAVSEPASLPIGNLVDPDLVIVTENSHSSLPDVIALALKEAGIDQARVALSFATRCRIIKRAPELSELTNCSDYLFPELEILSPKLIMLSGASVVEVVLGTGKMTNDHGNIFFIGPWALMPIYSLGYLARSPNAESELKADFVKAKEYLYGMG